MPLHPSTKAASHLHAQRNPSRYQEAILKWIRHGNGDAIVEAVAGSGKTTTLEMAWSEVQRQASGRRAILLAFNRSVASELRQRLPDLETRTLHSLGNRPTRARLGKRVDLDPYKYSRLAAGYLESHATGNDRHNGYLARDLAKIADLARLSLVETRDEDALLEVAKHHDIGRGFGRVEQYIHLVPHICRAGMELARRGVIDFTDQLWLPCVLNLALPQYDWLFIDESQDLNNAQLELVKRSRARGGRLLFVGDPAQAIYGFAGADASALEKVEQELSARRLPLSVTYRCPSSHVASARQIVPHLEARPGAPEGLFREISIGDALRIMGPGDMILSREVAPAVAVQRYLDDRSCRIFVDDRERWKELRRLLIRYSRQGIAAESLEAHLDVILARADRSAAVGDYSRVDAIRALLVVIAGRPGEYSQFTVIVDRVFAPRRAAARCLSIHKAKGLEADRVFLIRPDLLPHRLAKLPWQRVQEENLLYVAITRAKTELYVCHGELPTMRSGQPPRQPPITGGGGIWGTGFQVLRGQQPVSISSITTQQTGDPTARYELEHHFHQGVCLRCDQSESIVKSFHWRCR